MATPAGNIEIPIALLEPGEYTLRQYIGRAGFAGGAELDLSMDPTGTRIYFETDDAQTFVLMIADVAIKILESAPTVAREKEEVGPSYPIEFVELEGGAKLFAGVTGLEEAIAEQWLGDVFPTLMVDVNRRYWYVCVDYSVKPTEVTFEPRDTAGPDTNLGS